MHYCVVDTALGTFGLAWSDEGLRRVLLPDNGRAAVEAKLSRVATPGEPRHLPQLVELIVAYGEGQPVSFADLKLDLGGVSPFHASVYDAIRSLGWGETTTYGEIARDLGGVQLSRGVGQALGANPLPLVIPCHRVLGSGGWAGGFSAPGGVSAKLRMLALEGVAAGPAPESQLSFVFQG